MNIWNSWICNIPIAHRGLHDDKVVENSISAFKRAVDHGYAIELDVRITKDMKIIVFHDENLKRLTGINKKIQNCSSKELKEIKLIDSNESIPFLSEVLEIVSGQGPILVEIKTYNKWFLKMLNKTLKRYSGEFAIQSFNPLVLLWFRKYAPSIFRGQLSSFFKNDKINFIKKTIVKTLALNNLTKPDFVSYNAEDLPNKYMSDNKKIPCIAWVVKSLKQEQKLVSCCENIIFEDYLPNKKT